MVSLSLLLAVRLSLFSFSEIICFSPHCFLLYFNCSLNLSFFVVYLLYIKLISVCRRVYRCERATSGAVNSWCLCSYSLLQGWCCSGCFCPGRLLSGGKEPEVLAVIQRSETGAGLPVYRSVNQFRAAVNVCIKDWTQTNTAALHLTPFQKLNLS